MEQSLKSSDRVNIMRIFLLTSLSFVLSAQINEELLSEYSKITPFHEKISILMPVETCDENDKCSRSGQLEDNSERFNNLLQRTEGAYGENDPKFLASPLGQQYQSLKKFMQIHNSLNSCAKEGHPQLKRNVEKTVDRIEFSAPWREDIVFCQSDCRPKSAPLIGDLSTFASIPKAHLEEILLQRFMGGVLEARAVFAKQFGYPDKENITSLCRGVKKSSLLSVVGISYRKEKNICSPDDKKILGDLKKQVDISSVTPLNTQKVLNDLNHHIAELNGVLDQYGSQKRAFQEQWREEDASVPRGSAPGQTAIKATKGAVRNKQLLDLKKSIFDQYHARYLEMDSTSMGLLELDAIKKASGVEALERPTAKLLGFAGHIEAGLKKTDDFAPLKPITNRMVLKEAKSEFFAKTKEQIQDLIRRRGDERAYSESNNIAHFIAANPALVGQALMDNPEHASTVCEVTRYAARKKRDRQSLRVANYALAFGGGIGAGIHAVKAGFTLTGHLAVGGGTGALFGATDLVWHGSDAAKNRKLQETMLNAYLSGMGDDKSIEEIRDSWRKTVESEYWSSLLALSGFALADVAFAPLGVASKGGRVAGRALAAADQKATHSIGVDVIRTASKPKAGEELLQRILMSPKEGRSLGDYSRKKVQDFFNFISLLPKSKQDIVLNALVENSDDLSKITNLVFVKRALSQEELDKLRELTEQASKVSSEVSSTLRGLNLSALESRSPQGSFFDRIENGKLKNVLQEVENKDLTQRLIQVRRNIKGKREKKQLKKLITLLENVTRRGTASFGDFRKLTNYFYILNHSHNSADVLYLLSRRNAIQRRVETEIAANSIEDALKKLGVLKGSRAIDRFRQLRGKHGNIENSMVSLVLNYLLLRVSPVPFVHLPKISLMRSKIITKELIEKIKTQGFDASYDDLVKLFGRSATFDTVYGQARFLYMSLLSIYGGYLLYEAKDMMIFSISSVFTTPEKVEEYIRKNVEAEEVKQRQFEQWKQGVYDFTGEWPTQEQEQEQWQLLDELSNSFKEDFKAN